MYFKRLNTYKIKCFLARIVTCSFKNTNLRTKQEVKQRRPEEKMKILLSIFAFAAIFALALSAAVKPTKPSLRRETTTTEASMTTTSGDKAVPLFKIGLKTPLGGISFKA